MCFILPNFLQNLKCLTFEVSDLLEVEDGSHPSSDV